jgi:hypothetical protein
MFSIKNAFVFATLALAGFAAAAPVSDGPLPSSPALPALPALPAFPALPIPSVAPPSPRDATLDTLEFVDFPTLPNLGGRDTPVDDTSNSLVVILQTLEADLTSLSARLHDVVSDVDISVFIAILQDLEGILTEAVADVKTLVGLSLDVVLAVEGKVWSIIDLAHLLATVLSLVGTILVVVVQTVGAARDNLIQPLVASIGDILADLLTTIFTIVAGLLPTLSPLLGTVVQLLQELQLTAVLGVLHVA